MFSLAADGTTEPLDDWLEEFPTLKEAVSQDRWNCMRYDGKLIAVPGNNPSAVAIGFEARTDVLDELGIDAASIQTMEDMHALLLAAKQQNPSSVPLVPHFGQTLMMLDCDPLNNGLGVLLHNTGTEVVNLYDTPEYEELCNQMHQWYTEGLTFERCPPDQCAQHPPDADVWRGCILPPRCGAERCQRNTQHQTASDQHYAG